MRLSAAFVRGRSLPGCAASIAVWSPEVNPRCAHLACKRPHWCCACAQMPTLGRTRARKRAPIPHTSHAHSVPPTTPSQEDPGYSKQPHPKGFSPPRTPRSTAQQAETHPSLCHAVATVVANERRSPLLRHPGHGALLTHTPRDRSVPRALTAVPDRTPPPPCARRWSSGTSAPTPKPFGHRSLLTAARLPAQGPLRRPPDAARAMCASAHKPRPSLRAAGTRPSPAPRFPGAQMKGATPLRPDTCRFEPTHPLTRVRPCPAQSVAHADVPQVRVRPLRTQRPVPPAQSHALLTSTPLPRRRRHRDRVVRRGLAMMIEVPRALLGRRSARRSRIRRSRVALYALSRISTRPTRAVSTLPVRLPSGRPAPRPVAAHSALTPSPLRAQISSSPFATQARRNRTAHATVPRNRTLAVRSRSCVPLQCVQETCNFDVLYAVNTRASNRPLAPTRHPCTADAASPVVRST